MRVRFYKSRNGFRWTIYAKNGRKLANCGQGYSRKIDCVRDFEIVTCVNPRTDTFWKIEGLVAPSREKKARESGS